MSDLLAAVRRRLPGGHARYVERIFLHGYHAGMHDAAEARADYCRMCEAFQLEAEVFGA